ncbi:hypothetical protein [Paramylibacter kogurei]|uniref:hypothetical protein n=1 Tax=Paramylibacter kogurei TaxID=1889778 RepID=UPI0013FE0F54|nr:hypothetical protein [Amylibacter kogurei]
MYTAIIAAIIGVILGWVRAGKRGGNNLDKLQYAAGHAIAFGLIGLAIAIILGWLAVRT